MNEKPNYYAIIPANVRYDNELRANEKLLYGEITALSSKYGECTASNNYFAKLYEVRPSAISKWIKDLENKSYIAVEYFKKNKEIEKRIIKIIGSHKCEYVVTKEEGGYSQKEKENNTSNNNTSIKKEINKEKKNKYGEFENVLLTDKEFSKLKERFNDYEERIKTLSYYLASRGDKYKSHYATILSWANKESKKQEKKIGRAHV